jgi:hypothetical protein
MNGGHKSIKPTVYSAAEIEQAIRVAADDVKWNINLSPFMHRVLARLSAKEQPIL